MDKETQEYFENQFEMFGTPGWKDFIEKAQEIVDAYNNIRIPKSGEELAKYQGFVEMLDWLLGWEELVNQTFKQYEDSNEGFPKTV